MLVAKCESFVVLRSLTPQHHVDGFPWWLLEVRLLALDGVRLVHWTRLASFVARSKVMSSTLTSLDFSYQPP